MKIGIAGTSKFNNYNLFYKIVNKIIKKTYSKDIKLIILDNLKQENDFIGIPMMANKYANQHYYNLDHVKIDFNDYSHKLSKKVEKNGRTYNSNAGLIQNTTFLDSCDFIILFHREEKQFNYLIELAKKKNKVLFNFNLSKK